jgi:flavin reductase (DIM6/NTAB) family NADH-FMN oxidoreductase RutF
MSIEPAAFRSTLAQWASGVTVVTTQAEDVRIGLTVSSFSSVSLTPPLILVCIGKRSKSHQAYTESTGFAVNILTETQIELAKQFAGMIPDIEDRFSGVETSTAKTGAPILPGVLAWLDCKTYQVVDAGDHSLLLGEVIAAHIEPDQAPLLYLNRRWGGFNPLD